MQLTRYTDYAVRVLLYLAVNPERQCSIQEIAHRYDISRNHLMKIVSHLSEKKLVVTTRGRGGGVRLNKKPEEINLGNLIRIFEGQVHLAECSGCLIGRACGLTSILAEAVDAMMVRLSGFTLADILKRGGNLHGLLGTTI